MKRTPLKRHTPLQRKSRLRRESSKARKRRLEASPWRQEMRTLHKRCWRCGNGPSVRRTGVKSLDMIVIHEIANGAARQEALDKPYATLVLCGYCNIHQMEGVTSTPEQLAILYANSPESYDLEAFNRLVVRKVCQSEVDQFLKAGF